MAGALQDHDRALMVGRPSFGKSLLMRGFPLPDGSVVVLVIGHVKTPCGRIIQRQYRGISRRDYYCLARGEAGYYRVAAMIDEEIGRAIAAFGHAVSVRE